MIEANEDCFFLITSHLFGMKFIRLSNRIKFQGFEVSKKKTGYFEKKT